jgi:uncharacterized MAPEG superfamily protein
MNQEIFWLVATIIMTAFFWLPYIINRIMENGLIPSLQNPKPDAPPKASWAARLCKAHSNAIENLAIFAPLVILVQITNSSNELTLMATQTYFYARLAHFIIYGLGFPYLKTIAFTIGLVAQMALAYTLLM